MIDHWIELLNYNMIYLSKPVNEPTIYWTWSKFIRSIIYISFKLFEIEINPLEIHLILKFQRMDTNVNSNVINICHFARTCCCCFLRFEMFMNDLKGWNSYIYINNNTIILSFCVSYFINLLRFIVYILSDAIKAL